MMGSLPNLHELERIERKKEKRRERKLREEMAKNIKLEKNKLFQLKMPIVSYSPISTRSHRISPLTPQQLQAALSLVRRKESVNSSIDATSIRRLINLTSCRHLPGHKVSIQTRQKIGRAFTVLTIAHGLMCAILIPLFALQASNTFWQPEEQWLPSGGGTYLGSLFLSVGLLIASGMSILTPVIVRRFGYASVIAMNYAMVCVFVCSHLYPSVYTLLPAYIIWGLTHSPAWISKTAVLVHYGNKLSCSHYDCPLVMYPQSQKQQQQQQTTDNPESMDEHRLFCNRDQQIRRLVRWFHLAKDSGIIIGALITSLMLSIKFSIPVKDGNMNYYRMDSSSSSSVNNTTIVNNASILNPISSTSQTSRTGDNHLSGGGGGSWWYSMERSALMWSLNDHMDTPKYISSMLHENEENEDYQLDEHGVRVCGADMCPLWINYHLKEIFNSNHNRTDFNQSKKQQQINARHERTFFSLFKLSHSLIILIYLIFALSSLLLTMGSDKIQINLRRNSHVKSLRYTLLYIGPLAFFIGTEQAYILSDFLRAFVSCSLGINMVAGAIIGMGIMQAIVSCTLSMLLRHIKRIVVIVAAFFFHSCLLLALSTWKPTRDDSALFYVLAAAWGACNGIWETVLMAYVTVNHTDHIIEMSSPLQALRCLGLSMTFAAHSFLCETPKIITLVGILVLSVPLYALLEIRLEAQRKAQLNTL